MYRLLAGATFVVVVLIGAVVVAMLQRSAAPDSPWAKMPTPSPHVDHAPLIQGPLESGPEATRACLECHPNDAQEVMDTSHWTWAGQKVRLPGRDEVMRVGKLNLINNFCIHVGPNMPRCTVCHAGYGWDDDSFDFEAEDHVDCLVCHDQTNTYQKGLGGHVKEGVDLVDVARSVGRPTRTNCGQCHFKGGGGDAVKHGDMDGSMYFPPERVDVHMGKHDFQCVDCHRTNDHHIAGCAMSVCIDKPRRVFCTDCHSETPHGDQRLDAHTPTVACQTCHIPQMAIDAPTKMYWDWSQAGRDDVPEDPHSYLKKKGSFRYAQNVAPEYYWYNGRAYRYLTGDKVDPNKVVMINHPLGGPGDPEAKIWPFKVHRGKQIFDPVHKHLLIPKMFGPGGYWKEFDWDKALRLGSEESGLPYSGQYDFIETSMHWPLSHMVQAKEEALQCVDCHGERGRMNWEALGYDGDPIFRGDRRRMGLLRDEEGGSR
jgi:octaheme c-type cytochrome (tetrathionate reductase family)